VATFLMTADGTHGDVWPFIRLAEGLGRRGHEVVLFSHQAYAVTAAQAGVRLVATDTAEEYERLLDDHRDVLLKALTSVDRVVDFYHRNGVFEQIRGEYEAMAELARARPAGEVVLVGRHMSRLSVLLGREALGVPAAWVCVTPTQHMGVPLTERLYPRGLADPTNAMRRRIGLPPVTDWGAWLSGVDACVCLWPDWFDSAGEPAPTGATRAGFLLNDAAETGPLPATAAALVAPSQPRPILVTGGSGRMLHRDWYPAAVAAVAATGRPGIVVCRYRDLLPERLPPGVHWFPALPFATLMPEVAAVLHHGGILTSARAIRSGTPQVVLAHGVDRPDNARRLHRLGLAEWLPAARWTTTDIAALLRRVLTEPGYRQRADELAPGTDSDTALDTACQALEALIGLTPAAPAPTRTTAGLSPERAALLRRWLDQRSTPAGRE
jgi:UDP:flavonoid glycosyltransferase YjiC (YdhE family)